MRELNKDNSLEDGHDGSSGDVYDEQVLAQSLPVKCVSARGYKKLTGGMRGQRVAAHFPDIAATGIPALCDHACQLAEDKMLAADEAFINEAKRLLNSLQFWCSGNGGTRGLTLAAVVDEPRYRKFVDDFIKVQSSSLSHVLELTHKQRLFDITKETLSNISDEITTKIIDNLPLSVRSGSEEAIPTSSKWTCHWKTFQAIVCRDGVYENNQRAFNFNEELSEPFMRKIDKNWARTFNHTIALHARAATEDFNEAVASFGAGFTTIFTATAATTDQVNFEAHLHRFIKSLDGILQVAIQTIAMEQRAANRLPETVVQSNMETTYQMCSTESGKGMMNRMKLHIRRYLEKEKTSMFRNIEGRLNTDLSDMMKRVKNTVLKQMTLSCTQFRRDCGHLISPRPHDFNDGDQKIRQEIVRVLLEAQTSFDTLAPPNAHDGLGIADVQADATLGPCLELVLANPRSEVVERIVEEEDDSDSESYN